MLSPMNRNNCGSVPTTASQIGCGRSCLAHDPNAIRESVCSSAWADAAVKVAREVGYDDPFYFSRQFRRVHGVSPSDYRAQRKG